MIRSIRNFFSSFDPVYGMDLTQFHLLFEKERSFPSFPSLAAALVAARCPIVRVYFSWPELVKDPPYHGYESNWAWYDAGLQKITDAYQSAGLKLQILATIANAPSFVVSSRGKPFDVDFHPEYPKFVKALVKRYMHLVKFWEITNEPDAFEGLANDAAGQDLWGYHPDWYVRLLRCAYTVIKGIDPTATVVMGGIAYYYFTDQGGPFNRHFLDQFLFHGGGEWTDALNIHHYPNAAKFWESLVSRKRDLEAKVAWVRHVASLHGVKLPIWVTEIGMEGKPDDWRSLNLQAKYVRQVYEQAKRARVDKVFWWGLTTRFEDVHHELLTPELMPKPGFNVYRRIVSGRWGK